MPDQDQINGEPRKDPLSPLAQGRLTPDLKLDFFSVKAANQQDSKLSQGVRFISPPPPGKETQPFQDPSLLQSIRLWTAQIEKG